MINKNMSEWQSLNPCRWMRFYAQATLSSNRVTRLTLAFTRIEGRKRPQTPSLSSIISSALAYSLPASKGGAATTTAWNGGSGSEGVANKPSLEGELKEEEEWAAVLCWVATVTEAHDGFAVRRRK